MPSGIGSIGSNAFGGCALLGSISIPASVSSIDLGAFSGCIGLSSISIASGGSTYASSDGCIYDAALTTLIYCPPGKGSITLASTTTSIGAGAFSSNSIIGDLTIPSGVTTIEAGAFSGSGIATVTIPESVTSIRSEERRVGKEC